MAIPRSSFRVAALLAIALAAPSSLLLAPSTAAAATDAQDQDLKARKLFAGGDYRQALDVYVSLYAETLHPTYLRNIARCQQNLGEADKAIASFREYLRKAKDLRTAERQEIEGYIAEMEDLKRRQAGAGSGDRSPSSAAPADTVAAPPAAANLAAPPPATPEAAPAPLLASPAPAADRDDGSPFYTRAWFWVAIGAVAAGTVAAVVLLGGDDGKKPLATLDFTGKP
jgi:tetratricopeptide (TPR) repeat protein